MGSINTAVCARSYLQPSLVVKFGSLRNFARGMAIMCSQQKHVRFMAMTQSYTLRMPPTTSTPGMSWEGQGCWMRCLPGRGGEQGKVCVSVRQCVRVCVGGGLGGHAHFVCMCHVCATIGKKV